jgi:ABC-type multidrug transport system fused ATPase/permease subunit
MLRAYFQALAGFRRLATACVVLLLVSGLAEAIGIAAMLPLLSSKLSVGAGGRSEWFGMSGDALVVASVAALVAFGLVSAVFRYLGESSSNKLYASVDKSLRSKMTTALLRMRWTSYLQIPLGDGIKAAILDGEQVGVGSFALVQALGSGAIALVLIVAAFVIDPVMTAAVLVFGGATAFLYRRVGRRSHALSGELSDKAAVITESTTDLLSNAKFYRSTGLEGRALGRIHDNFSDWARRYAHVQRFRPATKLGGDMAGLAFIAAVLLVTTIVLDKSIASALVFLALFYRLAPRLQTTQQFLLQAKTQESWWASWKARYDACTDAAEERSGTIAVAEPPRIEFDRVSLTYPGRSAPALAEVSCVIEQGQRLAVVGESGSGKTTMLDLVTGLLHPTSGALRLNGIDLNELQRDTWRRRIGLVMQDSPIFHSTVLENIAFTDAEPDEQRAWWAADVAYLSDVVRALPDGLHTQLGQRGGTLSGGQRQRLALARALYRKPWLLVLDEATSGLDSESERVIQEALSSLRDECSMLIVAHRLKTVQIADHILVLSRGRVVEEGSWDELSTRDGLFRKMLAAQLADAPAKIERLRSIG